MENVAKVIALFCGLFISTMSFMWAIRLFKQKNILWMFVHGALAATVFALVVMLLVGWSG